MPAKQLSKGYKERLNALMEAEADTMDQVCTHVAQGGSLIDLCEGWDVVYGKIVGWINKDDGRKDLYNQALQDRNEWVKETILHQLREIANVDIRSLFDDRGNLKPVHQWDKDVAKAVAGIDVQVDKEGDITKKLKMNDKLKAIELIGKTMSMFNERVHHTGELTLADLVAASNKPPQQGENK